MRLTRRASEWGGRVVAESCFPASGFPGLVCERAWLGFEKVAALPEPCFPDAFSRRPPCLFSFTAPPSPATKPPRAVNLQAFVDSFVLMLVLFNPFLMSIYLLDVIRQTTGREFAEVLVRAFAISGTVFLLFAWAGDTIFTRLLQVRFAAFLIFGGFVFLVIALRSMVTGARIVEALRGSKEELATSIALPFMIGPGTVSASVLTGARLPMLPAGGAIVASLMVSCLLLLVFKWVHDLAVERYEPYVERYVEIAGRIAALVVGTIAVEMILKGVDLWWSERLSA